MLLVELGSKMVGCFMVKSRCVMSASTYYVMSRMNSKSSSLDCEAAAFLFLFCVIEHPAIILHVLLTYLYQPTTYSRCI